MRGKFPAYSGFVRSAWFAMAVLLVVCCGPVRKLFELHYGSKGIVTSSQNSDNSKLRTYYREKQEVATNAHRIVQEAPGVGLTLFLISSFVFSLLFSQSGIYAESHYHIGLDTTGVPLY